MCRIMKQESTLEKRQRGKAITDSRFAIGIRDKLYPLLMFLSGIKVSYKVEVVNTCTFLSDKPIIFVANHSAF